jgi:hypothetical protein
MPLDSSSMRTLFLTLSVRASGSSAPKLGSAVGPHAASATAAAAAVMARRRLDIGFLCAGRQNVPLTVRPVVWPSVVGRIRRSWLAAAPRRRWR